MQQKLIENLTDTEIKSVMNELYMDDAVDLIEEMPANVVKRILANTKPQRKRRRSIQHYKNRSIYNWRNGNNRWKHWKRKSFPIHICK